MLTAYYFRQHMYTLVPRYVREDMAYLADVGTDAIAVGLLEQDLFASVENVRIIAEEAAKKNIALWIVPSRWAGLIAGSPKVPSFFTATHEETYILNKDGNPHRSGVTGRISSVYHPATFEFMCQALEQTLAKFPVTGIIWDEVKAIVPDYSPAAVKVLGDNPDWDTHLGHIANFFSRVSEHGKQVQSDLRIAMFLYAHLDQKVIDIFARQSGLDDFGCDGRPWKPEDQGGDDSDGTPAKKTLLGPGERFLPAARANGKNTLMLIENHAIREADCDLMDRRLPEVLQLDVDHWLYYYYGRNCDDPERVMQIITRHLAQRPRS